MLTGKFFDSVHGISGRVIAMTKFGVHLRGSVDDPHEFSEQCRTVEELGFDSVWLADGLTRRMPEPFELLACASISTTRIMLGTCIYVLPVRHPLVTAKLSATLDQLCGGRFIFGVGVGWKEEEFKAVGVPFSKRGIVADECLQVLLQAWTGNVIDYHGDFFQIKGVRMELQPEQKPHPPIWVGGNGRAAAMRTARFADCWIPTDYTVEEYERARVLLRQACSNINRGLNQLKTASHLMVIIDRNQHEADRLAKNVADSLNEKVDELKKWAIVGDPKEVARRLEEYNTVGVSYHVLNFATNVRDQERIQMFAREILPSFK
jgi:probable F420-dependent oxidoreductase